MRRSALESEGVENNVQGHCLICTWSSLVGVTLFEPLSSEYVKGLVDSLIRELSSLTNEDTVPDTGSLSRSGSELKLGR